MKKLTKTGFQDYRACVKTFWLRYNRPGAIEWPPLSAMDRTRLRDGQQVEALSSQFIHTSFPGRRVRSQLTFETTTLLARADFVLDGDDRAIDLVEVKASTKVKPRGAHDHLTDAAFQLLVAERNGWRVGRVFLVHLNGNYRRSGPLDVTTLFVIVDITDESRKRLQTLSAEADAAARYLAAPAIDESVCDCLYESVAKRCAAFHHFNSQVPVDGAHHLPRISSIKLKKWQNDFSLRAIDPGDLSPVQVLVHRACLDGPIIDLNGLEAFLSTATYPIHFYDFETTGPAIPPMDGYGPYQALPVQFSLHRLSADGRLDHHEWLADCHGQQLKLIEALEACVGPTGSVIAWHKGFENGCNKRLSELHPAKADFLASLNERTLDLEDPFKKHYVDWGFRGSTSIKKVLPVLCPELKYSASGVHDGTGAVEAWNRMIEASDEGERAELRRQLLAYCKLDSLAMVQIHACLLRKVARQA